MDQPAPDPVTTNSTKSLQLGIKDGFVIIGINDKPIAGLKPEQAAAFAAMMTAKALSIAFGTHMVAEELDRVKQDEGPALRPPSN